nr:spore wall protein 2-like [Salvelinus alpinus]XP_023990367.1 spore wall protein 2-like [Salvelinus alpinus]
MEGEEDANEGMNDPTMPQILCVTGGALREREELDEEGAEHGQKVRSWEEKGSNRPEGTSSFEDGPAAQQQQEAEPAPEVRVDGDDQPSNQEGEISKQGGDNTGQDMRSSTAPRETKGEGPEREKEGKEGEDGRGMKRKREGEEEGTGQGTEKKKLDEEAMASMLADFVACPPDNVENVPSASNRPA